MVCPVLFISLSTLETASLTLSIMSFPVQLRADLYNAPPISTSVILPGGSPGIWQPSVITLLSGRFEAVLVDTLFTHDQGVAIADWLDEILGNKTLTTIYITHGHGDHWFTGSMCHISEPAFLTFRSCPRKNLSII